MNADYDQYSHFPGCESEEDGGRCTCGVISDDARDARDEAAEAAWEAREER